jgi:hypothetical protein
MLAWWVILIPGGGKKPVCGSLPEDKELSCQEPSVIFSSLYNFPYVSGFAFSGFDGL